MKFVLPKSIKFPGGFKVRVVETVLTEDQNAFFSYSMSGDAVLTLRKGLTQAQQKYYLSHELIHAMVDYHHLMIEEGGST